MTTSSVLIANIGHVCPEWPIFIHWAFLQGIMYRSFLTIWPVSNNNISNRPFSNAIIIASRSPLDEYKNRMTPTKEKPLQSRPFTITAIELHSLPKSPALLLDSTQESPDTPSIGKT
jgi:hypothetical protein